MLARALVAPVPRLAQAGRAIFGIAQAPVPRQLVVLGLRGVGGTNRRVNDLFELAGASALLVGTAIGGGFLALPHVTSPSGALPSSVVLVICWIWLLLEALLISDLVIDASANASEPVSFGSLSQDAFGDVGGVAVSSTFVVLMATTMVSQLSKGAEILGLVLPGAGASRAVLLAIAVAVFARRASAQLVSQVNGALTLGFVAATSGVFAAGLPQAVWSRLGRADWTCALGSAPSLLQVRPT